MCNWTDYEKESDSLSKRKAYSNVSVVHLPCLGRIDPVTVIDTFLRGEDGVLLVGCASPDCHFVEGNVYAEHTVKVLKKLLEIAGFQHQRLELRLVSPSEEKSFTGLVGNFSRKLKKFGSSPVSGQERDASVVDSLVAARGAAADFRLRALIAKEKELTVDKNAYGEKVSEEEFTAFSDEVIKAEFMRHKIILLAKKKPVSVKDISGALGLKPAAVLRHVLNMRRQGKITLDSIAGTTPMYKAVEVQQ